LRIAQMCLGSFWKSKYTCFARRERPLRVKYLIGSLSAREVELVMLAAARIKRGVTMRAFIAACHVLIDRHLMSASATEHRKLGPFRVRPDLGRMAGQGLMALLAGEINAAALHLDGDDVESCCVMGAAGFYIQIDSANFRARELHR